MKRQWTEEQKNYIINSYTNIGLTCTEIARKFAAKPDTISKYLKEWGIPIKGNRTKNRLLVEDYFQEINTASKAYFLGLLFADGSIVLDKKRNPNISLELVETDLEILNKFKNEINSEASFRYDKRANRTNGTYSFHFRSKKMADDLAKFNIVPDKTYKINKVIFPERYIADFLRGYIDGDGSIYFSNGYWHLSITAHSRSVVEDFVIKINQLAGIDKLNKVTCYNKVYKYTWNESQTKIITKILYEGKENLSITRKWFKAMAIQENKRVEDIV